MSYYDVYFPGIIKTLECETVRDVELQSQAAKAAKS